MTTQFDTRTSARELNKQIEQHLQELSEATDKARTSEEMIRYLDFCAKFHQYSAGNIWLILMAKPDASHVAGFRKWQTLGRWVRKGEHGIPILAPILVREEHEDDVKEKRLVGFKVVHIFDLRQTEGDPLPPQPNWKSLEKSQELNQNLIEYARMHCISVTFKDLSNDIQGVSRGGRIELDNLAGTKTLIHEIAHELLHQGYRGFQSKIIKELEAESIAYIVSRHFGLTGLNCPNYIALKGISKDQMVAHFDIIQSTAGDLIRALEGEEHQESEPPF